MKIDAKNVATGVILGVVSRQLFDWLSDKIKMSNLMFDVASVKQNENGLVVDLLIKNYSGSSTTLKPKHLYVIKNNKLLKKVPLNNNSFLMLNTAQLDLVNIIVPGVHENPQELTYKLTATINSLEVAIKPYESNDYGAIYNTGRAAIYQQLKA